MKKFLLTLLLLILLGTSYIYYYTLKDYYHYQSLSPSEKHQFYKTQPINYIFMKDLIFWDKSL